MYVKSSNNVEVKEPKAYGCEGLYSSDVSTAATYTNSGPV